MGKESKKLRELKLPDGKRLNWTLVGTLQRIYGFTVADLAGQPINTLRKYRGWGKVGEEVIRQALKAEGLELSEPTEEETVRERKEFLRQRIQEEDTALREESERIKRRRGRIAKLKGELDYLNKEHFTL